MDRGPIVQPRYTFRSKFGSEGSGDGQLLHPSCISMTRNGDIIVSENWNHRIEIFDQRGKLLKKIRSLGQGEGQLYYPWAVRMDQTGNLIVVDSYNGRVQVFSPDGAFLRKLGPSSEKENTYKFVEPRGVAIDRDGNYVVVDLNCPDSAPQEARPCHFAHIFNPSGVLIRKFPIVPQGRGPEQQQPPFDVAIDHEGNIIIPDSEHNRISIFSSTGQHLRSFGTKGQGDGQFNKPMHVAVDSVGNIIVSDYWNHRIQCFTSQGQFITKFGVPGNQDGEFWGPRGVAITEDNSIVVVDWNHRIQIFTGGN